MTLSTAHNAASNGWMIVNNKLEKIWKEEVVASFKLLSRHFLGGTEEKLKPYIRIVGVSAQIQNGDLQ
jgi:hypothetical protein